MRDLFLSAVLVLPLASAPAAAATLPAWLLSYEGKSTNQLAWDKRTGPLVRRHVPAPLSDRLLSGLGGPPDPVLVANNRYLSASACVPHACTDKGFFWIDSRTGVGLGAYAAGDALTLGSKDFAFDQVPDAAREALIDWLTEFGLEAREIVFHTRDGRATRLAANAFAPRPRYRPPAGGPSFDCRRASTRIEETICADPALAGLDLALSRTFTEIRQGHATVGARQELVALQRAWLRSRDVACEQAAQLTDCLQQQYRLQHERLMNWVPTH